MNNNELLIYESSDGKIKLDISLENETVWLTQEQMAKLFGKSRSTITEHIKNVFKNGELEEESNVGKTDIANSDKPVKINRKSKRRIQQISVKRINANRKRILKFN